MTPTEQRLTKELGDAVAKIADLEAALGMSDDNLGVAFKLSTSQNKLLGCLMALPNVTPEMIMIRLGIATDAKVAIHRLRETLKAYSIPVYSKRGLGYWLDAADKEKVKAITLGVTAVTAPDDLAEVA